MDSILMQKQVRENAQDLQEFYKELNQWGEKIKKREEWEKKKPQRHQISSAQLAASEKKFNEQVEELFNPSTSKAPDVFIKDDNPLRKKSKRIQGTDYAAWDKFDVDAYCAKLDKMETGEEISDPDSDEDEEMNGRLMEVADADKEKGNQYVKQGNWDEAIKCYTQAIDCYPYNAIYYANRALCYLKKKNYHFAETDCTTALQIDKTYIKAYLRRAAAREGLRNFTEAEVDLLKVFEHEPNNTEARAILNRIEHAMGSKITKQKATEKKLPILTEVVERKEPKIELKKEEPDKMDVDIIKTDDCFKKKHPPEDTFAYGPGGDKVTLLQPIHKCPRTRSKKSLKRVKIENVNFKSEQMLLYKEKMDNRDMPLVEHSEEMEITSKYTLLDNKIDKESENLSKMLKLHDLPVSETENLLFSSEIPKTSLQFYQTWNKFCDGADKYKYLKKFNPVWLRDIFKYNMENNVFGEILEILWEYFVPNNDDYFKFLMGLSKVSRFSAVVMFMTTKDQQYVQKMVEAMEQNNKYTQDDILYIKTTYELKN